MVVGRMRRSSDSEEVRKHLQSSSPHGGTPTRRSNDSVEVALKSAAKIEIILHDGILLQAFSVFCKSQHNYENLGFYHAVNRFVQEWDSQNHSSRLSAAHKVYDQFIQEDADDWVCLPQADVRQIRRALKTGMLLKSTFCCAVCYVKQTLEADILPRFLDAVLYNGEFSFVREHLFNVLAMNALKRQEEAMCAHFEEMESPLLESQHEEEQGQDESEEDENAQVLESLELDDLECNLESIETDTFKSPLVEESDTSSSLGMGKKKSSSSSSTSLPLMKEGTSDQSYRKGLKNKYSSCGDSLIQRVTSTGSSVSISGRKYRFGNKKKSSSLVVPNPNVM